MSDMIVLQFVNSTADSEKDYFTGDPEPRLRPQPSEILPAGSYRVIAGDLYRVEPGTGVR